MRSHRLLLWAALAGGGGLLAGLGSGGFRWEGVAVTVLVLLVGLPFALWVLKKALLTWR